MNGVTQLGQSDRGIYYLHKSNCLSSLKVVIRRLLGRCVMVLIIGGNVLGTAVTSGLTERLFHPVLFFWGVSQMRSSSTTYPRLPITLLLACE